MKIRSLFNSANIPFFILTLFVETIVVRYARMPAKVKSPHMYNKYITAFTAGEISRNSAIRVRFVDDMIAAAEVNKSLDDDYFSFDSYISGTTKWIDIRTIEFQPYHPLNPAKSFRGTLALRRIIPRIADSLSTFTFLFHTKKQSMDVTVANPSPMNVDQPQWQQIKGIVTIADYETLDHVRDMFSTQHEGKTMRMRWIEAMENVFHFYIDSILRTNISSCEYNLFT